MNVARALLCSTLLFSTGLVTTGCVAQRTHAWEHARTTSYRQHFRDWTRHDQINNGIVANATASVTCFSPAFAVELQKERSKRARHNREEKDTRLEQARSKANDRLEFFVALHTQNHYWNDLEVKRGTFKVQLYVDDKAAVQPEKIKRLNQNEMADWVTLFPTVGPLQTGYIIRFPPIESAKRLRLLISGNPGAMEMVWKISH
ncbi:MAG: hypothetical protein ACPGQS_07940 [Bradymonadia bacterium]